ncbi:hypothetical protein ME800_19180 [Lactobacillus delbrueckii]|nr:hypothetical protein ME800_19180 [Lactobacillus delbrueckii]
MTIDRGLIDASLLGAYVLKIPLTDIVTYIVAQIQGKHRK